MLRQVVTPSTDLEDIACEVIAENDVGNWIIQFESKPYLILDIFARAAQGGLSTTAQEKDANGQLWSVGPGQFSQIERVQITGPDLFDI